MQTDSDRPLLPTIRIGSQEITRLVIGGNPFTGGEGSLRRTLVGVLFIAVLNNGLSTLGMRDAYFYAYKGLAILVALFFDVVSRGLLRGAEPTTAVTEGAAAS